MKNYRKVDARVLRINRHELAARLASPEGTDPTDLSGLYEELVRASSPAYVATRVKLNKKNGTVEIGRALSHSSALCKLLSGSLECLAFVATLGVGVDRLILKRAQSSPYESFVIDAMADALVEALCDHAEAELTYGIECGSRFSPGYADIELALGREIITLTGADKLLGIRLTESGLVVPKKSVNALIPISLDPYRGE